MNRYIWPTYKSNLEWCCQCGLLAGHGIVHSDLLCAERVVIKQISTPQGIQSIANALAAPLRRDLIYE